MRDFTVIDPVLYFVIIISFPIHDTIISPHEEKEIYQATLRGSTIGLAGCGIWLIFVAIFGMEAENRSGKREFHLRAGAGFCVFEESGCENRKGKVAGYGILIFTRLHDLTGAG